MDTRLKPVFTNNRKKTPGRLSSAIEEANRRDTGGGGFDPRPGSKQAHSQRRVEVRAAKMAVLKKAGVKLPANKALRVLRPPTIPLEQTLEYHRLRANMPEDYRPQNVKVEKVDA